MIKLTACAAVARGPRAGPGREPEMILSRRPSESQAAVRARPGRATADISDPERWDDRGTLVNHDFCFSGLPDLEAGKLVLNS
jgi:hypothetical protein